MSHLLNLENQRPALIGIKQPKALDVAVFAHLDSADKLDNELASDGVYTVPGFALVENCRVVSFEKEMPAEGGFRPALIAKLHNNATAASGPVTTNLGRSFHIFDLGQEENLITRIFVEK